MLFAFVPSCSLGLCGWNWPLFVRAAPYRASGPIFVRTNAETAKLEVNEVPEMIRNRFLSIRGYDTNAMMLAADAVDGKDLEEHLWRFLSNQKVEYIHIHNARPGCYNCRVDRV